jgi:tetratricopeptide (TPR) repeat protein
MLSPALILSVLLALSADSSRILSLRNLGLAQLEEDRNKEARGTFSRLAELVPGEALPWVNGAVAALRENDLPAAEKLLARAVAAGGERADVWAIRAALENARNNPGASRAALAKAAALDVRDLESRWRFARSVDVGAASSAREKETRRKLLSEIVARSPANLPARVRLLLGDLEAGDRGKAAENLAEIARLVGDAEVKTKGYAAGIRDLLVRGDLKGATLKARVLENLLRVTPRYLQSLSEVYTNVVGLPVLLFSPELEGALRPGSGTAVPVTFSDSSLPAPDPSRSALTVDLMNSGKAEPYAIPQPYTRAVFFDFDLDGDLDVYLFGGGRPDRLVRNNLDGTFTDVTAATGDARFQSRRALALDFDRDGDLDLLTVDDQGELVLRVNERQGLFRTVPLGVSGVVDIAAEDLNGDGFPDIVAATKTGVVVLMNRGDRGDRETEGRDKGGETGDGRRPEHGGFSLKGEEGLAGVAAAGPLRGVLLADLDNDGFPDLIIATGKGLVAFRNDGRGSFAKWRVFDSLYSPSKQIPNPPSSSSDLKSIDAMLAVDVDNDGDLDLVLSSGGKIRVLVNEGGNANGWLNVALEGLAAGSGKVNRAGAGSFLEVKAGNLYVARTAGSAPTHFGLGPRTKADVVRCTWTNGVPQNLFDQKARTTVKEVQMLKGSCPFVYARNGRAGTWTFVSDALGRAPIGLLYDGVHLAGADPREWLFIPGETLVPAADGTLELDYTEELWEAAYLDEATLMAVDHPEGTQVVPNERTIPGPLERKLFTVKERRPIVRAVSDANGSTEDVSARLAARDEVYVDPGPETAYQGVRAEHALVLDLGPIAAGDRIVLFLTGWIFYTDTSINVSLSQRGDLRPFPPVLEVPDGRGGWRVAIESLGFPAGKTKTMPVELTGLVDLSDPRVRIRTTMAIFWDEAFVTVNDPAVPLVTTLLSPSRAVLSERGFSRRYRETPDGPEVFAHDEVTRTPAWEDIPGLVTRLGDVTELLKKTDDRWVVFKGGDAIRITYDGSRLPPVPPGWRRDYVLISDGWDKDFDKNTVTGRSYEPHPFHAMSSYPYPPSERHPDPAFLNEWLTRRVGPEAFREALREGPVAR